jgi:hypothetical protein
MKKRVSPGARRAIILIQTRAASAGWKLHSVDVTRADWQIPFVTSVVNTYACWRAKIAAEVCPTSCSWEGR